MSTWLTRRLLKLSDTPVLMPLLLIWSITPAEILLAGMVEDMKVISQLADIASLDGLDLIAIGPSDLSQALGVTDSRDPRLKNTIISRAVKEIERQFN